MPANTFVSGLIPHKHTGAVGDGNQLIFRTSYAGQPAAGQKGGLHIITDGTTWRYDDGSVLQPHGPVETFYSPPSVSTLTGVNLAGSTTKADSAGQMFFNVQATAADSLQQFEITAPAAPYNLEVAFYPTFPPTLFGELGLYFKQTSTGRINTMGLQISAGDLYLITTRWNNATTRNVNTALNKNNSMAFGTPFWMQLVGTSTQIVGYTSVYSLDFAALLIDTVGVGQWFTTVPDKIGFYFNDVNTGQGMSCKVPSWRTF